MTIFELFSEMWRLLTIVLEHRRLRSARVSSYALVSMRAAALVERMRERYPGKNFTWTFSLNHVLDVRVSHVILWEVEPGFALDFIFLAPVEVLSRMLDEGRLDAAVHGI
jgi:hypothetical protein